MADHEHPSGSQNHGNRDPHDPARQYGQGQRGYGQSPGTDDPASSGVHGGHVGGGSSGMGGQMGTPRPHDPQYHAWRERQNRQFDEDWEAFNRERQKSFDDEFDTWRSGRSSRGSASEPQASSQAGSGSGTPSPSRGSSAPSMAGGSASTADKDK